MPVSVEGGFRRISHALRVAAKWWFWALVVIFLIAVSQSDESPGWLLFMGAIVAAGPAGIALVVAYLIDGFFPAQK
jgi:hypothetical protein